MTVPALALAIGLPLGVLFVGALLWLNRRENRADDRAEHPKILRYGTRERSS
jgi:hypothetical protein